MTARASWGRGARAVVVAGAVGIAVVLAAGCAGRASRPPAGDGATAPASDRRPVDAVPRSAPDEDDAAFAARVAGPGAAEVAVIDAEWRDDARARTVPVRLRVPQPCTAAQRRPLVLFSHGLGGSRAGGAAWGGHWAAHGFVVVHLQHPGSDESLWRDRPGGFNRTNLREGMTAAQFVARVDDVRFAIARIAADGALRCADASRVGLSGHSFGARTTQAMAGEAFPRPGAPGREPWMREPWLREPRVAAAIAFSPTLGADTAAARAALATVAVPFLSVTGSRDGDVMATGTTPALRRAVHDALGSDERYRLWLSGADHFAFGGGPARSAAAGLADDAAVQHVVRAVTLAFWLATLRDDERARGWLAGGGPRTLLGRGDDWTVR